MCTTKLWQNVLTVEKQHHVWHCSTRQRVALFQNAGDTLRRMELPPLPGSGFRVPESQKQILVMTVLHVPVVTVLHVPVMTVLHVPSWLDRGKGTPRTARNCLGAQRGPHVNWTIVICTTNPEGQREFSPEGKHRLVNKRWGRGVRI